jgi:hypothetical protein
VLELAFVARRPIRIAGKRSHFVPEIVPENIADPGVVFGGTTLHSVQEP